LPLTSATVTQSVLFAELCDRPLEITFDPPHANSDGGAVLLKAADRRLGLIGAVDRTLTDRRDPARAHVASGWS
jgi:hypothetical protein